MANRPIATFEFASNGLRLRLTGPSEDLAPYIAGYYRTEVESGCVAEDWLPPEDGNLRTGTADVYVAAIGAEPLRVAPSAVISGPTDRVTNLRLGGGKFWGIGLTPAGWARLIGAPASAHANRFDDISNHPDLRPLQVLLDRLRNDGDDIEASVKLINRTLRGILAKTASPDSEIHAIHRAIAREGDASVAQLAAQAGMNQRTFERFCRRVFGFPPGALRRRQRFLRSLGKYMLDPSMRWIGSLDGHYHDQAHFIREFRATMQMTPSEFAERPHPILMAAVTVTNAAAGVTLQGLHRPRIEEPREDSGLGNARPSG
jgi:AraC-like DNA-binding protein